MSITYDNLHLELMSLFEQISGSKLKDIFDVGETMVFVVFPGQLKFALKNIQRLKTKLNKKFKIVEFSEDLEQFIRNMVYPLEVIKLTQEGEIITLEGKDYKTKGLLIGRNAQNLRGLEKAVQRYFSTIKEIKVV